MRFALFILSWLVAIGLGWAILGALAGTAFALLVLAVGTTSAAWAVLAIAVIAIVLGAVFHTEDAHR